MICIMVVHLILISLDMHFYTFVLYCIQTHRQSVYNMEYFLQLQFPVAVFIYEMLLLAPSLDVIMEHRLAAHWRQIAVSCCKHPASAKVTFMASFMKFTRFHQELPARRHEHKHAQTHANTHSWVAVPNTHWWSIITIKMKGHLVSAV